MELETEDSRRARVGGNLDELCGQTTVVGHGLTFDRIAHYSADIVWRHRCDQDQFTVRNQKLAKRVERYLISKL